MRRFLSFACVCCFMCGTVSADAQKTNFPIQSRLARLGAWATTALVFAGSMVGIEQACESMVSYLMSFVPFGSRVTALRIPRYVGGAISVPLATYFYVKYHQLFWYMVYIMYSGRQISPLIAHEIAQHLDSYVRCMQMIKDIHNELETLIKNAEACIAGSGKEEALKLVGQAITAVFERELADANAYLKQINQQMAEIKLDAVCKIYSARGGKVRQVIDLSRLRALEHPDFTKIDIELLDGLIRNILDYWHTYLTSLADAIDQRVALCKQIHSIETFISTVLNRPLFPAFQQIITPTPPPNPVVPPHNMPDQLSLELIKRACVGEF